MKTPVGSEELLAMPCPRSRHPATSRTARRLKHSGRRIIRHLPSSALGEGSTVRRRVEPTNISGFEQTSTDHPPRPEAAAERLLNSLIPRH